MNFGTMAEWFKAPGRGPGISGCASSNLAGVIIFFAPFGYKYAFETHVEPFTQLFFSAISDLNMNLGILHKLLFNTRCSSFEE